MSSFWSVCLAPLGGHHALHQPSQSSGGLATLPHPYGLQSMIPKYECVMPNTKINKIKWQTYDRMNDCLNERTNDVIDARAMIVPLRVGTK